MALAATREFVELLNKMVKEKQTSRVPLALFERILTNIVFIPEVTADHVDAVLVSNFIYSMCNNKLNFVACVLPNQDRCCFSPYLLAG